MSPHKLAKRNRSVSDVVRDSDSVTCKYLDKDKDEVRIIMSIIENLYLNAFLPIGLPSNMYIGGLVATNSWNQSRDAYGTLAYTVEVEDKPLIIFESHLSLANFGESQFLSWFDNCIDHINAFEALSSQDY